MGRVPRGVLLAVLLVRSACAFGTLPGRDDYPTFLHGHWNILVADVGTIADGEDLASMPDDCYGLEISQEEKGHVDCWAPPPPQTWVTTRHWQSVPCASHGDTLSVTMATNDDDASHHLFCNVLAYNRTTKHLTRWTYSNRSSFLASALPTHAQMEQYCSELIAAPRPVNGAMYSNASCWPSERCVTEGYVAYGPSRFVCVDGPCGAESC